MGWVFMIAINIFTNCTFWPSRFLRWVSLFWFWVAWGPFGGCWKLVLPSGLRRGLGTPAGSDPARGSTLQMSSLDPTSILLLLLKYAMLCPHLTRSERFPIPSWCFFIPRVLWRPAQLFSHLSALWLSRLGFPAPILTMAIVPKYIFSQFSQHCNWNWCNMVQVQWIVPYCTSSKSSDISPSTAF